MDTRQETNRRIIEQFRAGGPIEGFGREQLLLLTTTGRRTGARRTTPLWFERDEDDLIVIASNMAAPRHPDWYLNLAQNPAVVVEAGDDRFDATASTTTGERRGRVWSRLKSQYPFLAGFEAKKTPRTIPVVALSRA